MFAPMVAVQNPVQTAVSAFAVAPAATPALGNLPAQVVSAPIQSMKVADNRPNTSYSRSLPAEVPASSAFVLSGGSEYSDVYLEFPYSSSFLAQLFGQLNMEASDQASFFVDYETLSQYEEIKYKPSFAFRPRDSLVADLMEQHKVFLEGAQSPPKVSPQAPETEVSVTAETSRSAPSARQWANPSLYSEGVVAYSAVESRNLMGVVTAAAAQGNRQISAFI